MIPGRDTVVLLWAIGTKGGMEGCRIQRFLPIGSQADNVGRTKGAMLNLIELPGWVGSTAIMEMLHVSLKLVGTCKLGCG